MPRRRAGVNVTAAVAHVGVVKPDWVKGAAGMDDAAAMTKSLSQRACAALLTTTCSVALVAVVMRSSGTDHRPTSAGPAHVTTTTAAVTAGVETDVTVAGHP